MARRGHGWAFAAAGLCGAAVLAIAPLDARLSRALADRQVRWLTPAAQPAGVLVADIDEATLAELAPLLGPWPYRRDVYALVADTLRSLGAEAIVLDLLLADEKPGDLALARAIQRPGPPVVLAVAGLRSGPPADAGVQATPLHVWPAFALPARTLWPAPDRLPPAGVITLPLDDDGVLRRLPLWHSAQGRTLPVLPLAVLVARDHSVPRALAPGAPPRSAMPTPRRCAARCRGRPSSSAPARRSPTA